MRVTEGMRFGFLLHQLERAGQRLLRLQEQAASGRRVLRPSDDPGGAVEAMRLRARLAEVDRYLDNVRQAADWIAATESALAAAEDILVRARELALAGAHQPRTAEAYGALAAEVEALIGALLQVGNTQLDTRYLLGGHRTTSPPFVRLPAGDVVYQGDGGAIERGIGPGVAVTVNVSGSVLEPAFAALAQLRDRLRAGDAAGVAADALPALDAALDGLLVARTTLGARAERVRREELRLQALQLEARGALSGVEDADLAQLVVHLRRAEVAYQATLAVGARLIQPTLLEFLR